MPQKTIVLLLQKAVSLFVVDFGVGYLYHYDMIILISSFVLGLMMGSLGSVMIVRHDDIRGLLRGRSSCPHCHHRLSIIDLIPLRGYMINTGRCRYCHSQISPLYPLIEFVTGLVFMMITWYFLWQGFILLSYLLIVWRCSVVIAFHDVRDMRLNMWSRYILVLATIIMMTTQLIRSRQVILLCGTIGTLWRIWLYGLGRLIYRIKTYTSWEWLGSGDIYRWSLMSFVLPMITMMLWYPRESWWLSAMGLWCIYVMISSGVGLWLALITRSQRIAFLPAMVIACPLTVVCIAKRWTTLF